MNRRSRSRSRSPAPRRERDSGYSKGRDRYPEREQRYGDRDGRFDDRGGANRKNGGSGGGRQRSRSGERGDRYRDEYRSGSSMRGGDHGRGSGRRDDRRERERERETEQRPRPSTSSNPRHQDNQVARRSHPPRSRSVSRSRSNSGDEDDIAEKMKPNFGHSGLLAAETNTVKNIDGTKTLLKYNEPPEARKPKEGWRFYVFKDGEQVDLLHVNRQSAYLFGRDPNVTEVVLDHPSCSKQHAVLQYRNIQTKDEYGEVKSKIKPFIIDLESTNGTHVNGDAIPTSRYYELQVNDVVTFGLSTREYVFLHDSAE